MGARAVDRVAFGFEPCRTLFAEPNVRDLIAGYYEELSPLASTVPLDPDWDGMIAREDARAFCVWTARVGGTLAGFISFHLIRHFNYKTTLFAIDGGHFLAPAFRDKGRLGFRMWRTVEPALKERGAKIIMAHDNVIHSLLPFFLALEYEPRSTVFWKAL